jgi:hypothetical protein
MQPPPPPAQLEDDAYQGEAPERYAMVRALEGEVHVRKGDLDEWLSRGTPIAEGDVVESRGRGVLQLGDGTRVAFGGATRFTVGALFTDRNGEKQVLLRLDYGRLRVLLGGQSEVRFRVDAPSGSATCFDRGSFSLEAERDMIVRLKVLSGRVSFANDRDQAEISAGERLTVYSAQDGLDRVRGFNTYDGDDFDHWCDRAMVVSPGESWDRVPPELRYYSDELDNHGRWMHSDEFGDVWQPVGVAEDWRPYYDGRWAPYSGGMTWVSDEPWAYVAYHHGRWHWGQGVGWFWIPGINYSPAWVAWSNTPGYCGWAPLGYYNTPCHWGYGAWGGGYAWNVVSINYINAPSLRTRIYADPHIIRSFNGGPGAGRDPRTPWRRSPLMVSSGEFRNPVQMQTAFRPEVHRERLVTYERQAKAATGRTIFRREPPAPSANADPRAQVGANQPRQPFETRGRVPSGPHPIAPQSRPVESRPSVESGRPPSVLRDRGPEVRPAPSPQAHPLEFRPPVEPRRPDPAPRDRGPEVRPAPGRPADPTPQEPRSRVEDRRPDPVLRDRPVEPRPRPADERRVDPAPRERGPEPRSRVDQPERRPDAPKAERETRPAPRKEEPPRERPKEEKHQ